MKSVLSMIQTYPRVNLGQPKALSLHQSVAEMLLETSA